MHRTCLIFALQVLAACFASPVLAQPNIANPAFNPQSTLQNLKPPGQWTTCVASDARGLFIGTQSDGIWFQSAADKQWWHFTTREGLGADDITALCIDARGRLWAGHGRDGLSVGNGTNWRHFPAHSAPFGTHINALAVTKNGEVWVAGNENLAVFDTKNQWRTAETPRDLPTQQITVLSASDDGAIFVGTQTSGVWTARDGAHQNWQHLESAATMPDSSSGAGLPGNVINAILCAENNLWIGTNNGLALSRDNGATWTFRRGADWQERLWGLAQIVPPQEIITNGALLRADWVESLGSNANGDLIIGYRNGWDIRTPDAETVIEAVVNEQQLVRSITQNADASTCIASFGAGAFQIGSVQKPINIADERAPLPPAPLVPDAETLNALAAKLEAWPSETDFRARALPDDWTTRGDWLGRYGRYWAVMCALNSPSDYVWGAHEARQEYRVSGGRMTPGDSMRFYIHELYSADPNALEMPQAYFDSRLKLKQAADPNQTRRIAEWNDNGHEYPTSSDGPNLYLALDIPVGDFVLSLYDWNKDERQGPNARRDFTLSLRERPADFVVSDARTTSYEQFEKWPELARGRIQKFGSGVYKKFLIRGPRRVTLQVARNSSHNTLVMGVFLDRAQEKPAPYFPDNSSATENAALSDKFNSDNQTFAAAARLWRAMQNARTQNPARWASENAPFCAPLATWMNANLQKLNTEQRKAEALRAAHLQLATLLYECGEFAAWENELRAAGEVPARDIEHALTWDGKANYSGRGYRTIRNYLEGKGSTPEP